MSLHDRIAYSWVAGYCLLVSSKQIINHPFDIKKTNFLTIYSFYLVFSLLYLRVDWCHTSSFSNHYKLNFITLVKGTYWQLLTASR